MVDLVVRRMLSLLPTLFIVSIAVFALSFALNPDRAVIARAGGLEATTESIANARRDLGLDGPVHTRYVRWLSDVVQGDFGESYARTRTTLTPDGARVVGQEVSEAIGDVLPRTLSLIMVALVFVLLISVPVGIVGGVRPGSLPDRVLSVLTVTGLAIPNFVAGMLLVLGLSIWQKWLPAVGYDTIAGGGVSGWLSHLLIPALALAMSPAAVIARQLRSSLATEMSSQYVRTAWAKGASRHRVVRHHALRNALIVPLTVFQSALVPLLGGAVIIETLFGISGMGGLIINAVRSNDTPVLQAIVLLFVFFNVVTNLVVDILYGLLSPKMRLV